MSVKDGAEKWKTRSIHGTSALKRVAEERSALYQEDLAREKRKYGRIRAPEEQVGTKTWKSVSRIRVPSESFRRGFDHIDWRA